MVHSKTETTTSDGKNMFLVLLLRFTVSAAAMQVMGCTACSATSLYKQQEL